MRLRPGLIAATAVAALVPLAAAGTANAAGEFHVRGVCQTQEQFTAAGRAGVNLWGPNFFCTYVDGWYYLNTH